MSESVSVYKLWLLPLECAIQAMALASNGTCETTAIDSHSLRDIDSLEMKRSDEIRGYLNA